MQRIDPRRLLINIAKILERLGISYLITGGIAVLVWGRPRFTADIDIVVELKTSDVPKLESALKKLGGGGYVDRKSIEVEKVINKKGIINLWKTI